MTGWAEVTPLAGEGQKILMAAVFAFHTGKAVVEIAAVQIPVNDLLKIGTVEPVLTFKPREL